MVQEMKKLVSMEGELTVEERNLFSVAYKNVIGARRFAWRAISSFQHDPNVHHHDSSVNHIAAYRRRVEHELKAICNEVVALLDQLQPSNDMEAKVFFTKMKADYLRYVAEFSTGAERQEYEEQAHHAYESAVEVAYGSLLPTNPIRLGLVSLLTHLWRMMIIDQIQMLNYSVFQYEILLNPALACSLSKTSFDEAIQMLDSLDEDSYRDATTIMQLLRDGLTLWVSPPDADNDSEEDGDAYPPVGRTHA